jgi:hypothetical protein
VCRHVVWQRISFGLARYVTVLQAEVCAVKACTGENSKRSYCNRTFVFSQTAQLGLKRLTSVKYTLKWSGIAVGPDGGTCVCGGGGGATATKLRTN